MEKRKETEKKCNHSIRSKWKRMMAVALSVLMVTSVIDYSGLVNVNAQTESDAKIVTAFAELPEDICNQQITEGVNEEDINLPDILNVTVKSFVQENVDAVVESVEDNTQGVPEVAADETTVKKTEESTDTNSRTSTGESQNAVNSEETGDTVTVESVENYAESATQEIEMYTQDSPEIETDTENNVNTNEVFESVSMENITWKIDATSSTSELFDSTNAGAVYLYEPILPEGYTIAEGVALPQIKVEIVEEVVSNLSFQESKTIDGIEITVMADPGVFPEGAILNVKKIEDTNMQEKIEEAVKEEIKVEETTKTVEQLISFDITITDADGNELQPDTSKGEVKVSFAQLPMVTEDSAPTQELKVFHMDDSLSEATGLETIVNQEAESVEATAEHFSVYTVAQLTDEIRENVEVEIKAADGTLTYYDTIEEAITAAQSLSGCTVTLLKDVATEDAVTATSGTFILDLNGKAWTNTYSIGSGVLQLNGSSGNTASLTVKDSVGGGSITTTASGVYSIFGYTYYSLSLEGGSYTGIWSYVGNIADVLADGYVYRNNSNGTVVTDTSGNTISNVTVGEAPVKITAQPEDVVAEPNYSVSPTFSVAATTVPVGSGKTITFKWYKNGTEISGANNESYTVDPGLTEGSYTYYCAVTCDGYTVKSENAVLYVTSNTGDFEVTDSNAHTSKYPTLEAAITAATSKPNSTVKLLSDATTASKVKASGGTFTIDLNGHTWTSTASDIAVHFEYGNVTLKDSGSGGKFTTNTATYLIRVYYGSATFEGGIYENTKETVLMASTNGTMEKVTIKNGTFIGNPEYQQLMYFMRINVSISNGSFDGNPVYLYNCQSVSLTGGIYDSIQMNSGSVSTLLEDNYAYKQSGTWINNPSGTSLSNVTVQLQPVAITAQPQNAANATYGYTSATAISVSAETTATATGDITYQWYRVKSGSETSDTALGTTSTQTLPIGLDAGTHSFYCAVTCDGYIVNSENATFTVEPKNISDVESMLIIPDGGYTYDGTEKKPPVALALDGHALDLGTDYILDYMDNTDAGTASVTITGQGNYVGTKSESFYIKKATPNISLEIKGTSENDEIMYGGAVTYTVHVMGVDGAALTDATIVGVNCIDGGNPVGYVMEYNTDKGAYFISQTDFRTEKPGTYPFYAVAVFPDGSDTYKNYVLGENRNILSASISKTVQKADTSIAFNSSYSRSYFYTGNPLSLPVAVDMNITGATYDDVEFLWFDRLGAVLSDGAPSMPGEYILYAEIDENDYFKRSYAQIEFVNISYYDGTVTFAYNGSTTKADWYTGDVQISADGYTVSDSVNGTYADSYLLSGEGEVSKTLYFKQNGTGYITDGKTITVNIDKTAPTFSADTDGITISDNNWKGFLNNITFGYFFKENKDVSISATDSGSGVDKYYYYIDTGSTTAKTADELNALSFTEGSSFSIADENKYIIYAYAVDLAGNKSAYICTDGIVIDKTAPTVTLTAPMGSDLGDVAGEAKVKMNETGIISYVIKNTEQSGMTAQNILDSTEKKTVSVTDGRADKNLYVALSGLTANTTYYMYAVGTDSAGNNSEVKSISFITKKTTPLFDSSPTITGTYGQQVKDMTMFQPTCTNGVAGSWSVSSIAVPSVGSTEMYEVKFTPEDASKYEWISEGVKPTVLPKSLTAAGVTIGEVTGTYTYDKTEKVPTVIVTDSEATITASDYEYSYSNNVSAGTATVTVTAKGNYTGSVSRTFTIAKAQAPSITYPTASGITYGQKLSASILTGGSTEYGTFAWTNGDTVPTVANSGYDVTFAPSAEATANYEISTRTEAVSVTVSKADPVTSVSAEISGNAGSRQATLTATLTGSGDGDMPAGTIQFVNTTGGGTVNIGSAVTLVNGTASFEWTGLADQAYTVKAVYSGSGNYNTAESSELEVDTRKQNQAAFSIGSISPKTYGDGSFTLSATGGSGAGAITFESSDSSIVSISGSTATIHKAGTVAITATKAEDATFNAATATASLTIAKKTLSIGTGDEFSLSTNSYTYNGSAREPAVTIKLDGKTLAKDADYTVTYSNNINAGTALVSITGMGNYQGTLESNFTIAKAGQAALSITEVIGKKYLDGTFTLTTSGGSGTGAVTYSVPENNSVLSVSGDTVTIIGVGTVTVTATKAADDNYNSITATREITVGKAAAPSITYPTASSITYGQKLSVSTLSGGSTQYGTFVWTNSSTIPTVTNSGYDVTFTPNANTMANYEAITGTTHTVAITVSKATPAVTVSADISDDEGSRKATLTATVTGAGDGETPTGTVKFVNSTSGSDVDIAGATAVTITGGKATYTWIGLASQIYKVKAIYSGSGNYNTGTSTELSFDTNKQNQAALRIGSIGTKTYGDGTFTLSATGGSGGGAVIFESSDPTIVSISGTTATIHKAGTVTINATKAADNTYNEATASVSLTVGKKALTIKANDQLNIIKGAAIPTLTYTVTGIVDCDTFTSPSISTTATDTNTVGEYDITISGGTLANADSYAVTYTNGKLTVVNATYTVTVTNGTGGGSYSEGQTVTITADSRGGYTFTGWSSSDGVTFASNTASTTTFTMPGKAVTVTANYSKNSSGDSGNSNGGSTTNNTNSNNDTTNANQSNVGKSAVTGTGANQNITGATQGETDRQTEKSSQSEGNKPYLAGEEEKSGWEAIMTEIKETSDQESQEPGRIMVEMNGGTIIPANVIASIRGKNLNLVLDMGDGITWTINGMDVSEDALLDIDLGVTKKTSVIPEDVVNRIRGENRSIQIELAHNGAFGFKATLTIAFDKGEVGKFANLFYYNEETGKLEYLESTQVEEDGKATLTFVHASAYTIVLSNVAMDESAVGSLTEKENQTENSTKTDSNEVQATEETSGNMMVFWILLGIIVVVVIGGTTIYTRRKNDRKEDNEA